MLAPFVFAFLLAYFLDPIVVWLRRWYVPRILSAFVVFIIAVIIIGGILFLVIPPLQAQIVNLIVNIPNIIQWLSEHFIPWVNSTFDVQISFDLTTLKNLLVEHLQPAQDLVKVVFNAIAQSGHVIFETLLYLVMIPVVTLYLLCDWQKVKKQGRLYIPLHSDDRETMMVLLKECGDRLAGFIRGQLLVMIGLAIVYSVGLWIVGLDVALLVGICSGILSVVPYLGFFAGIITAMIVAGIQFQSWWYILFVFIVYAVGEICESFIFSPFFVGDRIGLHPVAVILALLIGGRLFGFVGVLLALPAAAVIMVFWRYACSHYFPSNKKGEHV